MHSSSSMPSSLGSDTLIIITGASRGIGQAIAIGLAADAYFGSAHFLLTSTQHEDLQLTQQLMLEKVISENRSKIQVQLWEQDFADLACLESNFQTNDCFYSTSDFTRLILILNHGTLGPLRLFSQSSSNHLEPQEITRAFDVNVSSCAILTQFLYNRYYGLVQQLDIINISSLAAIQPFPGWSTYCMTKAAREILMQVLAIEHSQIDANAYEPGQEDISHRFPTAVRTLNYAPGIVDTDMQHHIRTQTPLESQRTFFQDLFESKKLIHPQETSRKLIHILKKGWQSGTHVDYYDDHE